MMENIIIIIFIIVYLLIISYIIFKNNNNYKKIVVDKNIIKYISDNFEILEIYNLLTKDECKEIIESAKYKGLHESGVVNYLSENGTEINKNSRTSQTCWLDISDNPIIKKIAEYSEKITGIPINHQEMMQVAYYKQEGKFIDHYDACTYNDITFCDKMNNNAGQRRATLLLYLNDDFQGGQTEFVQLKLSIKPQVGKAILFWNVDQDEKLIIKSKHKAKPVISGEKWICTIWSHIKPYKKN